MATKSMLKNVKLKDRYACHRFIRAIENAKSFNKEEVRLSRPCKEASEGDIKEILGSLDK